MADLVVERILSGIVGLALTAYALLVIGTQLHSGFDLMTAFFGSGAAAVAILCWWFALRGQIAESRRRIRLVIRCGLTVGAIGFAAGFIGPIIMQPGANQGPLLGIFITGPLGFMLGAAMGWIYTRIRGRTVSRRDPA